MFRTTALMFLATTVSLAGACRSKAEPSASEPEAGIAADDKAAAGEPSPAAAKTTPAPVPAVEAQVGQPAPDFSLTDLDGNQHTLSQYKGKMVVLEWFNPGCPFVEYAHTKGELVNMAKQYTADGVVWLAINSGAPGKQGHGGAVNREAAKMFSLEHPILLDEDGTVGHRYGAEKTPHMYVIDEEGALVYRGAIDNAPFGEVEGGGPIKNYVSAAFAAVQKDEPVDPSETASYGCTVKYDKG